MEQFITGWVNCYKLADMKKLRMNTDECAGVSGGRSGRNGSGWGLDTERHVRFCG